MKNKKGFTMVELLAVIVILGILFFVAVPAVSRWIERGKKESSNNQKQTLLMAGQSYGQANKNVLPKVIGETVTIKANDLKEAHYLKEDLKNTDNKSCMDDSYVKVYKYSKTNYTYTAFLYCEGDTIPESEDDALPKPEVDITFTDDNGSSNFLENVSITKLRMIIKGSEGVDPPLGVDGYSYIISVMYTGESNYVEIYNSGSLNGGGKETLVLEKSLRDYVDVTKTSDFSVTVIAYNRAGGKSKFIKTARYGDNTEPICGTITGQAEEDEWDRNRRSRTISITCSDGAGSGCVKDTYTKTFDTQMDEGVITIKDNAGNSTDCSVRVHLDWTAPTLTVTAYKRTSGGGKGSQIGSITANEANKTVNLNSYSGASNGWLNTSVAPSGVYYEITATDNVLIDSGQWSNNSPGIYNSNSSSLNKLTPGNVKKFTKDDKVTSESITEEGLRRAKYEVSDRSGSKVSINITANLDRTNPICSTSKGNIGSQAGVSVSISCADGQSGVGSCPGGQTGVTSSRNYTVKDKANNSGSCGVSVSSYACAPYQCKPYDCNPYEKKCGTKTEKYDCKEYCGTCSRCVESHTKTVDCSYWQQPSPSNGWCSMEACYVPKDCTETVCDRYTYFSCNCHTNCKQRTVDVLCTYYETCYETCYHTCYS